LNGKTREQIKKEAMSVRSLKRLVDPKDIATLAVLLRMPRSRFGSDDAHRQRHAAGELILSLNRRSPPML
jgi:hypothetical protein